MARRRQDRQRSEWHDQRRRHPVAARTQALLVAAYLTGSKLDSEQRDALLASLARALSAG
jgi:hypothetical protein